MKFHRPSEAEKREAIGSLDGLTDKARKAILATGDFEPIPAPGPNDWLAVHPEAGQTFADFVRARPNKPDAVRNTLYLQPLEDFENAKGPASQTLARFAGAFFSMPVQTFSPSARDHSVVSLKHYGLRELSARDMFDLCDFLRCVRHRMPFMHVIHSIVK